MDQVQVTRVPGWLAWLLAIPALVLAALFGVFVFLAVLGLVLVFAVYLVARVWWLRRKMRGRPESGALEGEYVVVRERSSPDDRRLR